MTINKQALREAAMKAKELGNISRYTKAMIARLEFKEAATPDAVLALLDDLEDAEKRIAELERGSKVIKCWSCQKSVTVDQVTAEDGFCPSCNCGIDLDDYETAELVAAGINTKVGE